MESKTGDVKVVQVDEVYYNKIKDIKERYKDNPDHVINQLDLKDIYILAIAYAISSNLKPKESKKLHWIARTEYFTENDMARLNSLIFDYTEDIFMIFPDKRVNFFKITEGLANAGMEKTLDIIMNDPEGLEELVLMKSRKIIGST